MTILDILSDFLLVREHIFILILKEYILSVNKTPPLLPPQNTFQSHFPISTTSVWEDRCLKDMIFWQVLWKLAAREVKDNQQCPHHGKDSLNHFAYEEKEACCPINTCNSLPKQIDVGESGKSFAGGWENGENKVKVDKDRKRYSGNQAWFLSLEYVLLKNSCDFDSKTFQYKH